MKNQFKLKIDPNAALSKAMKYCAYRERSVAEVETKLKEWGLSGAEADHIIDDLVEQNFINEERYLTSYVRGKFNNNKWGLLKIRASLRQQKFTDERISWALQKIDRADYLKTANLLIRNKIEEIGSLATQASRSKLYYFMVSKGYEPELIMDLMRKHQS